MKKVIFVLAACFMAACLNVSLSGAGDGHWKLEKVTTEPEKSSDTKCEGHENAITAKVTKTLHGKPWGSGIVDLTWTKLPEIVIPNKEYSVTVHAIVRNAEPKKAPPLWSEGIYFYPVHPSGAGACAVSIAGIGEGGSYSQGRTFDDGLYSTLKYTNKPITCTYKYSGGSSSKTQIIAVVNTPCTSYKYTYKWNPGLPSTTGGDKTARCEEYARTAVNQNKENLSKKCGFTGLRWTSDYNGHLNWCMNNEKTLADSETRTRDEELRKCAGMKPPPDPGDKPIGYVPSCSELPKAGSTTLQTFRIRVEPFSTVKLPVCLLSAKDIASLNFDLTYKAEIAQATGSVNKGGIVGSALFAANAKQSGIVRIGFAGSNGVSGSGEVASITFTAKGSPGQVTPLHLKVTTSRTSGGAAETVATVDGEIRIATKTKESPTTGISSTSISSVGASPVSVFPSTTMKPTTPTSVATSISKQPLWESIDAKKALDMSVGLLTQDMKYDVDKSGAVDARDATLILQAVVGKR